MCTGIRLIAGDGTVVHARTMEFGSDIKSNVIVVPGGSYVRTGTAPKLNVPKGGQEELSEDQKGATWETNYASVGANAFGLPIILDGLNEAGLAVGTFYFPTAAGYMPYSPSDKPKTIAPWELGSWILDQYQDVVEVKEHINKIVVADVVLPEFGFVPPTHYVVHDAGGNSIVIEYVGGKLNVHDNPLGVMSNSPTFDWHMTNLRNYVNFSVTNLPPLELKSNVPPLLLKSALPPVKLEGFGQGTGMLGLPGDLTPPSRFVRAVAFSQSILPELIMNGADTVLQAFHILNNFDIPKGVARDRELHEGEIAADYTIWTSANDLKAKRFYFRTYENSQIRMVDLMEMKNVKDITTIDMYDQKEVIRPVTPMMKG